MIIVILLFIYVFLRQKRSNGMVDFFIEIFLLFIVDPPQRPYRCIYRLSSYRIALYCQNETDNF